MLIDLDRHAEALQLLEAHFAVEPEDSQALCLAAQAELGLDRSYRALAAAQAARAADPGSEWAWRLQALALARMRSYDDARASADTAVRLAPSTYQTHAARAQVCTAAGAMDEAAASAAKAIELAPDVAANWSLAGIVELRRKRLRHARAHFRKALSLDPTDATAQNNLAVVHLRRRRLGRAIHGFLATARADPHSDLAVRNLRVVLNYTIILMTILVWITSAIARAQVTARGLDGPNARTVIALAAAVPLLAAVLGYGYLRHTLADAFGVLMRGLLRSTWRVGTAIGLVVLALVGMLVAAVLPPRGVQPMLLVASAAAFGAVWAIPRRLPSSERPGRAR